MGLLDRLTRPSSASSAARPRRTLPNERLAEQLQRDPHARSSIARALAEAPRYHDAVVASRRDWVALSWELDGLGSLARLAAAGPDPRGGLLVRAGEEREALGLLADLLFSGRALIAPSLKRDEEALRETLPERGRALWDRSLRVDPAEAVDLLLDPPSPALPALARASGEPGGLALAARELERRTGGSERLGALVAAARRRDPIARARLAAVVWREVLAPRLAPFSFALDERAELR